MKLAAITFSRNDGYKENERFLAHMKTLLDTFDEVNYIDWNSPTRSLLYEIIDQLPKTGRIKHFVITPEIHNLIFQNYSDVPKVSGNLSINIALRRTDADWIALTTTDNIPPTRQELEDLVNSSDEKSFYTFSRREIEYDDVIKNINNLSEYREYLRTITEPRYYPAKVTPNDEYSIINCCGDFQFAPKQIWDDIKGIEEKMIYNCFIDTNVQKKVVINNYNLIPIFDIPMYHMSHKNHLPQGGDTTNLHENAKKTNPPVYNNAWDWIEFFTESQNEDNWGFKDTEIEYETI
jgi:hypothetical protein